VVRLLGLLLVPLWSLLLLLLLVHGRHEGRISLSDVAGPGTHLTVRNTCLQRGASL
jgi:hypothetical protein